MSVRRRRPARSAAPAALLGLVLAVVGLPLLAPVCATAATAAADSAERQSARLTVSPKRFVAGQGLRFRGRLPQQGRRQVHLEFNMNRPGDIWRELRGSSRWTEDDGSFDFRHPAPGMFGVSYRVAGGGLHTGRKLLEARSQDLLVWVSGEDRDDPSRPGRVRPRTDFGLSVDTTPRLHARPDLDGTPVLKGRVLRLQQREDATTWTDLATTRVRKDGMGYFTGVRADRGTQVYRVVAEDWNRRGSRIGWFPSFPTYVEVGGAARPAASTATAARPGTPASRAGSPTTPASTAYGWWPVVWDFAWEHGESLTAAAYQGSDLGGRWEESSTGTGRVAHHNGGLALSSGRHRGEGDGNRGTTRAWVIGAPMLTGRWEVRMRTKIRESSDRAYRLLAELVPARGSRKDRITMAEVVGGKRRLTFGLDHGSKRWRGKTRISDLDTSSPAIAVEVGLTHVTWLVNGRAVGTLAKKSALIGRPLTLRLSLVGRGQKEMNYTELHSDWQRAFPLSTGQQVRDGKRLRLVS